MSFDVVHAALIKCQIERLRHPMSSSFVKVRAMKTIRPSKRKKTPVGVLPEIHQEIMRRINNRYYENRDICSLRRGGPGLPELAAVIHLATGLPAAAIKYYAKQIARLRALYPNCMRCQAKVCGLTYLLLSEVDPELAKPWLRRLHVKERCLARRRVERDFIQELRDLLVCDIGKLG